MKRKLSGILLVILSFILTAGISYPAYSAVGQQTKLDLSETEQNWLKANSQRTFILGLDPQAGMEHFLYRGQTYGYIYDLVAAIQRDVGIKIRVDAGKSWGQAFAGIKDGSVDILIGANETPERKTYMSFTRPIYKYPYALFSYLDSNIETIGDIDGKKVAFISGDIVVDIMSQTYRNIKYIPKYYPSQDDAMRALAKGDVSAFVTSGGEVAYDYIQRYPNIRYISKINTITSDMTLSTNKKDSILSDILDKELATLDKGEISEMLAKAEIMYNRKLMNLSEAERKWLEEDGQVVVGITRDYLPIDYYSNGKYLGISGAILNEIGRRTGIHFIYEYSDFDSLYSRLEKGVVNVLNLAKTEDRLKEFIYPKPYLMERDTIYGRRDVPDVVDVYGLEGKKVAVVKGFWHIELLKKNLSNVRMIETSSVEESMRLLDSGKADYFIENPSVVRYYMEELDMFNIMQKGTTSNDSYLYYGISKNKPELASIIDKVIPLLNTQELVRDGFSQVPRKTFAEKNYKLLLVIFVLVLVTAVLAYVLYRLFKIMVKDKAKLLTMEMREEYLNKDALTGFYNRNYLNDKIIPGLQNSDKVAIVVCDMNNLKTVNDKYGHHMGDQLLKAYSGFLRENAKDDAIIRLGGDEFLIVMPQQGKAEAKELVDRMLSAPRPVVTAPDGTSIEAWGAYGYSEKTRLYPKETAGEDLAAKGSFEESILTAEHVEFLEMIKEADRRMYELKRLQKHSGA